MYDVVIVGRGVIGFSSAYQWMDLMHESVNLQEKPKVIISDLSEEVNSSIAPHTGHIDTLEEQYRATLSVALW